MVSAVYWSEIGTDNKVTLRLLKTPALRSNPPACASHSLTLCSHGTGIENFQGEVNYQGAFRQEIFNYHVKILACELLMAGKS